MPGVWDVFVRDRHTGATERLSVGAGAAQGNNHSYWPSVSADGRYVAFYSLASNLVPGDTNGAYQILVRHRGRSVEAGDLLAIASIDRVSVSGWAAFSGQVISSVTDPPSDGVPGAGPAGADLTGASLTYRPEDGDLLLRLRLESLPGVTGQGGYPAVLYGLAFDLGGVSYEVRAIRAGATAVPPAAPYFALYRCDLVCTEQTQLSGGIGTTGTEVLVSVPLATFGGQEGAALAGARAFSALGDAAPGGLVMLDEATLLDATIPQGSVTLGVAQAGTPEGKVDLDVPATLANGSFSGSLPAPPPGDYDVWARACLGAACTAASTLVTIQ